MCQPLRPYFQGFLQQVQREEAVLQLEDVLFDPIIVDDVVPPLGLVVLETLVVVRQCLEPGRVEVVLFLLHHRHYLILVFVLVLL
jgi:hypothetical protein